MDQESRLGIQACAAGLASDCLVDGAQAASALASSSGSSNAMPDIGSIQTIWLFTA
jgi:hypothetical protein